MLLIAFPPVTYWLSPELDESVVKLPMGPIEPAVVNRHITDCHSNKWKVDLLGVRGVAESKRGESDLMQATRAKTSTA